MRHIVFYIIGFLSFHAMPPLLAARPDLAAWPLPPPLLIYASAALLALAVLRAGWAMRRDVLALGIVAISLGILLAMHSASPFPLAGFLLIGMGAPLLVRHAFEDAAFRNQPVGRMLALASISLEALAFAVGALASHVAAGTAASLLALVPLAALCLVCVMPPAARRTAAVPAPEIIATIRDVIPAVAANTAFLLFLSGLSVSGGQLSPMQVGAAIALTAVGFAGGAYFSDLLRRRWPDRLLLLAFSCLGLCGGAVGSMLSLADSPELAFLMSICISSSNGAIVAIALSAPHRAGDPGFRGPADNALIFLSISGIAALAATMASNGLAPSGRWLPMMMAYAVAVVAVILQDRSGRAAREA